MMNKAKPTSRKTRSRGFSLIEMLTVTGISATLVGAGVPVLSAMGHGRPTDAEHGRE